MNFSFSGAWVTFQVTFTELFIAATLFTSVAYKRGWRSAVIGTALGASAIVVIAYIAGLSVQRIPFRYLDWISALLLLGFGGYLIYEFVTGLKARKGASATAEISNDLTRPMNWPGVSVAAWAVMAEGLEIAVVWLAISVKQGMTTATTGVGIGILVIAGLALILGRSGIFRKIPPVVLDGLAAVMINAYAAYFIWEAVRD